MARSRAAIAFVPLALLAGCSGLHYEPFTYTPVGDMRPRPGLFSGPDGEFVVYRKEKAAGRESASPATRPDAP